MEEFVIPNDNLRRFLRTVSKSKSLSSTSVLRSISGRIKESKTSRFTYANGEKLPQKQSPSSARNIVYYDRSPDTERKTKLLVAVFCLVLLEVLPRKKRIPQGTYCRGEELL